MGQRARTILNKAWQIGFFDGSAWTVFSLGLLLLAREWWFGLDYTWWSGGLAIVGLAAVSWFNRHLAVADSTRELHMAARSGKAKHAGAMHKARVVGHEEGRGRQVARPLRFLLGSLVAVLVFVSSYYVSSGFYDAVPTVVALGALLIALIYAVTAERPRLVQLIIVTTFLVLISATASWQALVILLIAGVFSVAWSVWYERWGTIALAAVGVFANLLLWSGQSLDNPGLYMGIFLVSSAFSILALWPFMFFPREVGQKERAKAVFALVVAYLLLMPAVLHDYLGFFHWINSLVAFILILMLGAGVSYANFQQRSYAKYYALAAVVLTAGAAFTVGSPVLTGATWLILSILCLQLGLRFTSVSLRLSALVLLVFSFAYYLLRILPQDEVFIDGFAITYRVWLGLPLVATLFLTGIAYKDLEAQGRKKSHRALVRQTAYVAAIATAFGLTWLSVQDPYRHIALLVLGLASFGWGTRQKMPLIQAAGIALSLVSIAAFLVGR